MSKPVVVTDKTFEAEVLKADSLVLVDFWAGWCAPCRLIAPVVEDLAEEYQGRLKVAKVDVDANPNTPGFYNVRGIPTLLLVWKGKAVDQIVGAVPKPALKSRVDAAFARHVPAQAAQS